MLCVAAVIPMLGSPAPGPAGGFGVQLGEDKVTVTNGDHQIAVDLANARLSVHTPYGDYEMRP